MKELDLIASYFIKDEGNVQLIKTKKFRKIFTVICYFQFNDNNSLSLILIAKKD